MWHVVRPFEHLGVFCAVEPVSCFEHADFGTSLRENVRCNTATGSRADDDDIVCLGVCLDLGHVFTIFAPAFEISGEGKTKKAPAQQKCHAEAVVRLVRSTGEAKAAYCVRCPWT